jgi:hypothetical protein
VKWFAALSLGVIEFEIDDPCGRGAILCTEEAGAPARSVEDDREKHKGRSAAT